MSSISDAVLRQLSSLGAQLLALLKARELVPIPVFALVVFLVVKQPVVRIPVKLANGDRKPEIRLDYGVAPIIGVVVLLATSSIGLESVLAGIVGNVAIRPYSILILFMALAYICVSIDLTGFFAYLALLATKAAGNSGRRLFVCFYALSGFLTVFTSNDIVILTMTPIIYYFAKNTNTDPIPFLIAQFFAANIWSIALYIGNPTNIIVSQAYGIGFLEYSKCMLLPTLVAGVSCLAILWQLFKEKIPEKVNAPDIDPRSALINSRGAVFGVVCLSACLLLLSLSSWLDIPIWAIPLSFSLVMLTHDVLSYRVFRKRDNMLSPSLVLRRMPWKIMPFVTGFFIMVEGLDSSGWVDLFASSISAVSRSLLPSILLMGFLSSLASNVMNNQPMTILFTKVLQSPSFNTTLRVKKGSMFALILGSNFGANFTPIGALAGIMWSKILLDKGITIRFKDFLRYGLLVMPAVVALACLVLAVELAIWP